MGLEDIDQARRGWEQRAIAAQAKAAQAYAPLIDLAETRDSGQIRIVARFIAGTFDSEAFVFNPFDLRMVDVDISDDMLACLDALRWGKADLHKLVPDGRTRVLAIYKEWNLSGEEDAR